MTDPENSDAKSADLPFTREDVYTITDLEQIKVMADPLRLRILEALCRQELTTKQVAERIDEKPTRLYHHVEALERVGLIRRTRTRQNRGTVEKYYIATAKRFIAGVSLFTGDEDDESESGAETVEAVTRSMFENTAREMRELITSAEPEAITEEGLLTYAEVQSDADTIRKIRTRFLEVLEEFKDDGTPEPSDSDARRFRLLLAFFPLDGK